MSNYNIKENKNTSNEEDVENLKHTIEACEKRYKESFKTNMCKEIMSSWYALQNAKSKYYKFINKDIKVEESNNVEITQDLECDDFI